MVFHQQCKSHRPYNYHGGTFPLWLFPILLRCELDYKQIQTKDFLSFLPPKRTITQGWNGHIQRLWLVQCASQHYTHSGSCCYAAINMNDIDLEAKDLQATEGNSLLQVTQITQ